MQIHRVNFKSAIFVDGNTHVGLLFLGIFLVNLPLLSKLKLLISCVDGRHLLFIIEFTIKLIKLVLDSQEQHTPGSYWVVVVFHNDASRGLVAALLICEEVKVGLKVVILDPEMGVGARLGNLSE